MMLRSLPPFDRRKETLEPCSHSPMEFIGKWQKSFLYNMRKHFTLIYEFKHYRVLEIQSSGRRRELRFQYRIQETVFSETFPIDLADDNWHKIAITISDIQLDLYVDCVHRFQRQIMPLDRSMMIERNLTLWLGQRGSHHFMYQVRPTDYWSIFIHSIIHSFFLLLLMIVIDSIQYSIYIHKNSFMLGDATIDV